MRLLCFFLFLLSYPTTSVSQSVHQTKNGSHFGFSYGFSQPINNYRNQDDKTGGRSLHANGIKQKKSGYALLGQTGKFYLSKPIYKELRLSLTVAHHQHPVDEIGLGKRYSSPSYTTAVHANDWKIWTFLLGPSKSYTRNNWNFDVFAKAGMGLTTLPYHRIAIHDKNTSNILNSFIFYEDNNCTFAFNLGGSIRYTMSKHIHLGLHLDYYSLPSARYSVNGSDYRYDARNSQQFEKTTTEDIQFQQNIEIVNISLGICYQFTPLLRKNTKRR